MLNNTAIQGRLTRDPELRATNTGKAVVGFTVAWSEKYGDTEQKLFLPCVAWGNQAEFVSKYFVKGQECIVEGKLTSRKWQDKNGNDRETIELIANHVHFCGPKQNNNSGSSQSIGDPMADMGGFSPLVGADNDLPF